MLGNVSVLLGSVSSTLKTAFKTPVVQRVLCVRVEYVRQGAVAGVPRSLHALKSSSRDNYQARTRTGEY